MKTALIPASDRPSGWGAVRCHGTGRWGLGQRRQSGIDASPNHLDLIIGPLGRDRDPRFAELFSLCVVSYPVSVFHGHPHGRASTQPVGASSGSSLNECSTRPRGPWAMRVIEAFDRCIRHVIKGLAPSTSATAALIGET